MAQHSQRTSHKRRASNSSARDGKIQKKQTTTAGISNRPLPEEYHRQEEVPPRGRAKE
jgi:hypothetical protein